MTPIGHDELVLLSQRLGQAPPVILKQTFQDLELSALADRLAPGSSSCARLAMLARLSGVTPRPTFPAASAPLRRPSLARLAQVDAGLVLHAEPDPLPRVLEVLLPWLTWIQLLLLLTLPQFSLAASLLLVTTLINLVIAVALKRRVECSCWREITVLRALSARPPASALGSLWMLLDDAVRWDPLGVMEYLRIALGLEAAGYARANALLRDHPADVARLLLESGDRELASRSQVDECLSKGSWEVASGLAVERLAHPLVAGCQPLDVSCGARVLIVTGDNMSGKSTLLRALGLDILLRETMERGVSRALRLPVGRVESLIGKRDDRAAGESLFLRELRQTREAADRLAAVGGVLLLDEPFSGTHRSIRHALILTLVGASEYQRVMVVMATHDDQLEVPGAWRLTLRVRKEGAGLLRELGTGPVCHKDTAALMRMAGWSEPHVVEFQRALGIAEGEAAGG